MTWVGADLDCKRDHNNSHLASVTDRQTDDFIARNLTTGESIWIGARQSFDSKGNSTGWAWVDGCSSWNHSSWESIAHTHNSDDVSERECAFLEKKIIGPRWGAARCDHTNHQFRYVCSKRVCARVEKHTKTAGTLGVGIIIAITGSILLLLLAVAVVVVTCMLKRRKQEEKNVRYDENPLYGQYYKVVVFRC